MQQSGELTFENTSIAFEGKNNRALKTEHLLFRLMNNKTLVTLGIRLTQWAIAWHLPVKGLIKSTIYKQFCGGETLRETVPALQDLQQFKVDAILDYGVEGKEDEAEFKRTAEQLIQTLRFAATQPNVPFISCKVTGLTRFDLLEKWSNGSTLSAAEEQEKATLLGRIHEITQTAASCGIGLFIDAEESWIQAAIDQITFELMRQYNKEKAIVYSTPQMYRHDRLDFCHRVINDARQYGYIAGLKPVRGAYMEKERKRAAEMGYPDPIQPDKSATDRDYDAALLLALNNLDCVSICAATHNEASSLLLAQETLKRGLSPHHPHIHFSQLYGMSDHITFNLAKAGFRVSKYLPYGPVKDVIPYLMRRAQENTSVAGSMSRELSLIHKEIKRRGL